MTIASTTRIGSRRALHARDAARGLGLAASPTFALMAWSSAHATSAMALCTSSIGGMPIDGMAAMYALMGVFHLAPWLRLSRRRRGHADPSLDTRKGERP